MHDDHDLLAEAFEEHFAGSQSPQLVAITERIATAFRREATDQWGLAQPLSPNNTWIYDRHAGPSHIMQLVLDQELGKDDYEAIERTCPDLSDGQRLLGEFDPEEIQKMDASEIITRNAEAFFFTVMWDVWENRFSGDKLVVAGVGRSGVRLLSLLDPQTHACIQQERSTGGYYTTEDDA